MRILIIEDDEVLIDILMQSLNKQHYVVDNAVDGLMGWEYVQGTTYDLIIIDVGLPKLDGISLCQKLRASGCYTPILLMTAKDGSSDRIRGLDAGADDYVVKPLDLDELQARVRALLRRGEVPRTPVLEISGLRLDPTSCQVTYKSQELDLTPKEYSLLELLMRNPSRVFSRSNIIEHLWSYEDPPQEETVKSHIKWLRSKLKAVGAVDWIENVYGVGYRLKPDQSPLIQTEVITDSNAINKDYALTDTVVQQFRKSMRGLWQKYQGVIHHRLEVLLSISNAIRQNTLTPELIGSGQQAAHKLAGVLGMFDLETGTAISQNIENLLSYPRNIHEKSEKLLIQIHQLEQLLNAAFDHLQKSVHSHIYHSSIHRLLIVDPDLKLQSQLQCLTSPDTIIEQLASINDVNLYLQNKLPDLVIFNVDDIDNKKAYLTWLINLSQRTPPIPVIFLAHDDGILDRVTVARAGGRGFLVKPVTAEQIWQVALPILQQKIKKLINILVVDDDPLITNTLCPILEPWGMKVTGLNDPLRFWDVLQSLQPDLLILDVEMPQFSGIELCQAVRTAPQWQGLPILFLTAHRDIETVQQVFTAGGDDYIVKPIVHAELINRILHRLERNNLLLTLSRRDTLTGLLNQLSSSRELQNMLQQAEHKKVCFALLAMPELSQINVHYSHEVGNQVLQTWSRMLQAAFPNAEVLGYWGNGEFVIGTSGLTKIEFRDLLADILTNMRQKIFTAANQERFQVICQWVVVEYPRDGETVQSLYQAAHQLLSYT
ncbi:multi-component transcriptional regulator, winged helix family [Richelia sinica FACHB-800]|uniref:Multi-component transcriptional regulator, winged helix family n=1 Tax=Richelia sinica FACHB-800 TaxID=1357546 RepID=A0A975T6T5_9NOST|nr:response regulator [Richelia sinica]MBD2664702.1 response regulator [Richelia sinica FACHB-800]QXE23197.1 multi-component transcriptional regulator, winged helix family [Richelia sinica FACHB-800]